MGMLLPMLSIDCLSQASDISPYSSYGIGDLNNETGIKGFSMGQTGIAVHNDPNTPFFINFTNPASYAYYYIPSFDSSDASRSSKIACFEAGMTDNNITLLSQGSTHTDNNTNFSYAALAFPISRSFGASIGLVPMSSVGYNIITNSTIDSNGHPSVNTVANQYTGSGGVNRVYAGLAWSPFRNFAIGANCSYLFGNLSYTQTIAYPLNLNAFNSEVFENTSVRGFYFNYGMMFSINLPAEWNVTFGATVAMSATLYSTYSLLTVNSVTGSTSQISIDTIQDSNSNGKIRLPMMLGGGITFKKGEKWTISFDYSVQNWSQYYYFGQQQNLSNSYHEGLGIQYIPHKNFDVPHSLFRRIHYRAGCYYSQTLINIDNTPIIDKGVTLGIGVPIGFNFAGLKASVLNIGLQVGRLGNTSNDLLQENYWKLAFAFTFNDRWFSKNQFQ